MDTGRSGVEQMLTKLRTTARLMYITAHPDDEDGGLMALESRGHGVTVELFTLTRGDGGQNKTGARFSDELGVLRTLELLESDRYYGVEQRFSRVADFGFSKTPEETFQKWGGHDIALADLVRGIREFQPDVVAARFTGTSRDGHGNHQASGILAREAVIAAADPNRFPEQIKEGLLPWRVQKLYHDIVPAGEKNIASMDAGVKLPYLDETFADLGAAGYSHQASQNATYNPPPPGPSIRRYKLIWPTEGTKDESDLFEGVETRLDHLFDRLPPAERELLKADEPKLGEALKQVDLAVAAVAKQQEGIEKLQKTGEQSGVGKELASHLARVKVFVTGESSPAIPLLRGKQLLKQVLQNVEAAKLPEASKENLESLLRDKSRQFQQAANLALDMDCYATVVAAGRISTLIPGRTYKIQVSVHNLSSVVKLKGAQLAAPSGWNTSHTDASFHLVTEGNEATFFTVPVPSDAALTRPYWHRDDPEKDSVFTVGETKYATLPLPPASVKANVTYTLDGLPGEISAIATGAPRRALAVEPAFSLGFSSATRVVPLAQAKNFSVEVEAEKFSDGDSTGTLHLTAPPNWKANVAQPELHFKNAHSEQSVTVNVSGDSSAEGTYELRASLDSGGHTYNEGFTEVTRDDLDRFFYFHPAVERISIVDVKLPEKLRVCYVQGAGDEVENTLNQLGMSVKDLPADQISADTLKKCDTVVLGIRAYDTQPALKDRNKLLLDFVQNGGTLLVQNNFSTDDFNSGHFTPYDAQLGRQRVSDETAPVEIKDASSPILRFPNQIAEKDFNGWVQERGVNFMSSWGKEFQPLVCSHDPGEQPLCGGLLTARYGKGLYIYTGYTFFRQLPAGVPGAIRLFVNLVSAGHEPR
jgi:LmbE family N-acetylglucosaminyl deacetylase